MQVIDLTRLLDPGLEGDVRTGDGISPHVREVSVPQVEYLTPREGGADRYMALLGCSRGDLPRGEGWGEERIVMRSSHLGTHVDAPLHYGSLCEGKRSRTISDISVQELFCDGFVLDVRDACEPGEAIPVEALARALEENGAPLTPGCAVLLRTGQENYAINDPRWYTHRGNSREGTLFLADAGAKVLGTDASWDRPFPVMRKLYEETGDPEVLWDGHRAGRDKEVFIVQKLENLKALPPNGFKVGFFPIKLRGASGAPARVVAFVND